jgi:hypothetical protein
LVIERYHATSNETYVVVNELRKLIWRDYTCCENTEYTYYVTAIYTDGSTIKESVVVHTEEEKMIFTRYISIELFAHLKHMIGNTK